MRFPQSFSNLLMFVGFLCAACMIIVGVTSLHSGGSDDFVCGLGLAAICLILFGQPSMRKPDP